MATHPSALELFPSSFLLSITSKNADSCPQLAIKALCKLQHLRKESHRHTTTTNINPSATMGFGSFILRLLSCGAAPEPAASPAVRYRAFKPRFDASHYDYLALADHVPCRGATKEEERALRNLERRMERMQSEQPAGFGAWWDALDEESRKKCKRMPHPLQSQ